MLDRRQHLHCPVFGFLQKKLQGKASRRSKQFCRQENTTHGMLRMWKEHVKGVSKQSWWYLSQRTNSMCSENCAMQLNPNCTTTLCVLHFRFVHTSTDPKVYYRKRNKLYPSLYSYLRQPSSKMSTLSWYAWGEKHCQCIGNVAQARRMIVKEWRVTSASMAGRPPI